MPDGNKQPIKLLEINQGLIRQKEVSFLWLRIFTYKCIKIGLYKIPGEPCLSTDRNGILLFFYIDGIVFAYISHQEEQVGKYIRRIYDA